MHKYFKIGDVSILYPYWILIYVLYGYLYHNLDVLYSNLLYTFFSLDIDIFVIIT